MRIWLGGAMATVGLGVVVGSAQAAQAYTGEAVPAMALATAYGYVDPQGETTTWAFAYGPSSNLGSWSKPSTIHGGHSVVLVAGQLGPLKALTTYHYRLFALPYDSAGNPDWAHASWGQDSTFTTTLGNLNLLSTRLVVTRGTVALPLQCASTLTCSGSVSIDTRAHVHCLSQRFSLAGGARTTFDPRLSSACGRQLAAAPGRRLTATATGRLSTGQIAPRQTVTLSG